MSDKITYSEYRAMRAKTPTAPASAIVRWARDKKAAPVWDWAHDGDSATRELDGFELRLRVSYDEYGDTSWLGHFTDTYEDGAVQVSEHWRYAPAAFRNDYRWFVPGISIAEHRAGLRKLGYARHVAYTLACGYARADMNRAQEIALYECDVTASCEGIELGSASMGGIDVSDDHNERIAYIEDVANELADEALSDAREALAKLRQVSA